MAPTGISILKSKRPEGPYVHAFSAEKPIVNGIDPTLFEDDDHTIYFTYSSATRIFRMKDDMSGVCGGAANDQAGGSGPCAVAPCGEVCRARDERPGGRRVRFCSRRMGGITLARRIRTREALLDGAGGWRRRSMGLTGCGMSRCRAGVGRGSFRMRRAGGGRASLETIRRVLFGRSRRS